MTSSLIVNFGQHEAGIVNVRVVGILLLESLKECPDLFDQIPVAGLVITGENQITSFQGGGVVGGDRCEFPEEGSGFLVPAQSLVGSGCNLQTSAQGLLLERVVALLVITNDFLVLARKGGFAHQGELGFPVPLFQLGSD